MLEEDVTIDSLTIKVLSYNPDADVELLRKAYVFSREAHCSQKRIEGTPYINHPLSVADILADMKVDVATIAAGLLHDTIEDTGTTPRDIKEIFGDEIAFLVESLTKLGKIEFKTKEEAQAENFRKMLLAMSEDIRVIIIKFADRLHNMRTLQFLPENKRRRIATETLEIYAPLANRLGIGWLKIEFEDLSFSILMPELYDELVRKVAKRKEEQEGYLKEVADAVEEKLREEGLHARVSGRVKHYYGIYQKMQRQRITFDQVNDVLGLRIITDSNAACYTIMGIIHSLWTPIPGRFKDYIAMPKSNMYQSLHTSVIGPKGERVEFQIRTEDMHNIAEEGIASHWKYKEKDAMEDRDAKYIAWLRELIQSQKELRDAREFLEEVKGEVVPEVVYVFTPTGEIKELPVGSTPVDFAYDIHTQVGHKCVGAKVNGRIVPLRYQLRNGDTIEIITSPSHGPSRDWLKFVVTQRAKNRIKQWIKSEERKQSSELGMKLLEVELRKHHLKPALLKTEDMDAIAKEFSMQSFDDLLVSVGYGKVSPHQVINRFLPEKPPEEILLREARPRREQKGISIKGIDHILYHTAKCCFPIPGDVLVGFVTRGRGVTIHRRDCPNLESLAIDNARLVDVDWKPGNETTSTARLMVETVDRPGVIADLSALISSVNVNISHFEATTTQDKKAFINFNLEVRDKIQLSGLIQKIAQTEGVLRVRR
ncbi:MAG: bifunctional (p)ppGpp synthetase/guanosine-3',5'-bis(diphosphate) 3'-pyrophosphohydrolase [Nitrospirae bacterium]|nr:bifunctional (p)ppGpp synthetase/guanosine-3',5'-bis(diphosphate) 3'-pyrophosphohydrolase [Nitrospirota bacterium]MCL5423257.1 bifunctional (p)ppGpp synthetase/guanosine-3',5'-bis(diphosphate) 3'-pyrophosphohydrolase [Nitrospirota bacterium]